MTTLRVLAIGFERGIGEQLGRWAEAEQAELIAVPDIPDAARRLSSGSWNAVVVAPREEGDDLSWWRDLARGVPGPPGLILCAAHPSMDLAVRAERLGVRDVLPFPITREAFSSALATLRAAAAEVAIPLAAVRPHSAGEYALVGESAAMLEVYKMVARVASSRASVLLQGSSGTGKEVVARALHAGGATADAPFVAVNCAAIPENLLESELFGHEKGAFTGAVTRKLGRFELAHGGVLFLDEVADMSLPLQAKVLRALQEREIERLGGGDAIPIDIRLIAATNRDLLTAIDAGRFREDLFYRLAVVTIRLPDLAERAGDLWLLTAYFVDLFSRRYDKAIRAVSDRALALLESHPWTGNVRELRNAIERAVIVATGDTLRSEHLPDSVLNGEESASLPRLQRLATLAEAEARHIATVLAHTAGQIGAAAEILGIHRNTLSRKIREYGL